MSAENGKKLFMAVRVFVIMYFQDMAKTLFCSPNLSKAGFIEHKGSILWYIGKVSTYGRTLFCAEYP